MTASSAVFLRCNSSSDPARALAAAVTPDSSAWFERSPATFSAVPASPFAYWVSDAIRRLFDDLTATRDRAELKQGLATTDDFRFVRHWWATPTDDRQRWRLFVKGGVDSLYYRDIVMSVDWKEDGAQSHAIYHARRDAVGGIIKNPDFYYRPGLTWPSRPHQRGSFACVPEGCIFSHTGTMAFADLENVWADCALFNSSAFIGLLHVLMPRGAGVGGQTLKYEIGYVGSTPVPDLTAEDEDALAALARRAWSLKRTLDTRTETSHAFALPALLQVEGATLADRTTAWSEHVQAIETELGEIQAEIDERCFELYGIGEEDRRAITEGFGASGTEGEEEESEEKDEAEALADQQTLAAELISWAVGVAFGRFDVRLATGARELPEEPEPLDPLPVCSAAMLTGDDGLPLAAPPPDYPISFPTDGILVDDEGHERDLTAAVHAVIDEVFGTQGSDWWQELSAALDPKGHDLRTWLAGKFFDLHLKSHSKSRRKAPIVWQLATPSKRYSVWLYVHRLTADSLFQLQGDIVAPKLDHEGRRLNNIVQDAQGSPSAKERKEIDKQEQLIDELRAMQAEVKLVAPLWRPELDDGIVLVKALLRNLVPHHKPWQRELNKKWSELAQGKYDWAQIAMHLWPERVVPKCAEDRSLAIAHDLEEVFWFEGEDGKWQQRETPTRPIDELVSELRSPAVEAALEGVGGVSAGVYIRAHRVNGDNVPECSWPSPIRAPRTLRAMFEVSSAELQFAFPGHRSPTGLDRDVAPRCSRNSPALRRFWSGAKLGRGLSTAMTFGSSASAWELRAANRYRPLACLRKGRSRSRASTQMSTCCELGATQGR